MAIVPEHLNYGDDVKSYGIVSIMYRSYQVLMDKQLVQVLYILCIVFNMHATCKRTSPEGYLCLTVKGCTVKFIIYLNNKIKNSRF